MQRDVILVAVTDPAPAMCHNIIRGQVYRDGQQAAIINPETEGTDTLSAEPYF